MNFFFRNPAYCTKNPRKAYATTKAMRVYREANPVCAWCGREGRPVHVHHLEPISYAPDRAADPSNFMTLCAKRCHLTIGHAGNFKNYVSNASSLCDRVRIGLRRD